jgi:hypothetical protein
VCLDFIYNLLRNISRSKNNSARYCLKCTYIRLRVNCPLFLSDLNETLIPLTAFRQTLVYQWRNKTNEMHIRIKVNYIFKISMLLLHVSALYERHLQAAQRILMKLCACYVISAKIEIKYASWAYIKLGISVIKISINGLLSHSFYDVHIDIDIDIVIWKCIVRVAKLVYQISWKSVQWELIYSIRTDRLTVGHDEANSYFTQFCKNS